MRKLLAESIEKKGTFQLFGDLDDIRRDISFLEDEDEELDEIQENQESGYSSARKYSSAERQADADKFLALVSEEINWDEVMKQIARKKNGTFYKGRVVILHQGHSFSYEDMESYGMRGPELRIKTYSDTEALVEFHHTIIEKW